MGTGLAQIIYRMWRYNMTNPPKDNNSVDRIYMATKFEAKYQKKLKKLIGAGEVLEVDAVEAEIIPWNKTLLVKVTT